jgi:enoyl-CoA hydratase
MMVPENALVRGAITAQEIPAMREDLVLYMVEEGIARITMNRPEALNALDDRLNDALAVAWDRFAADDAADVAVLSGEGRAFCTGADLKSFIPRWQGADMMAPRRNAPTGIGGGLTRGRHRLVKPVVAALHGHVIGGGFELALACDIRIAAEDASFGVFELRYGLHQGDGGLVRLSAIAGIGTALDLTLTGRPVDAAEALRLRLVSRVVPRSDLMAVALETAARIRANGRTAVRSAKETVLELIGRPLDDALRLETLYGYSSLGDFGEAGPRLARFLDKTPSRQDGER